MRWSSAMHFLLAMRYERTFARSGISSFSRASRRRRRSSVDARQTASLISLYAIVLCVVTNIASNRIARGCCFANYVLTYFNTRPFYQHIPQIKVSSRYCNAILRPDRLYIIINQISKKKKKISHYIFAFAALNKS